MKILFSFSIVVATILVAACGDKKQDKWATYNDGKGAFSVEFPGPPSTTQKTIATPFGKQVENFIAWKPGTMDIYKIKLMQVSYVPAPASIMNDSTLLNYMLDSSIKMRQKDFTEKEFLTQKIEFNGYPGRAFIYQTEKGNSIVIVKQCITNNRRYDLVVIANANQSTNPEIARFFNSFQALK